MALGLANSYVDVVERLGAAPGGVVELSYKLATATADVQAHVLVACRTDGALHVSVHGTPEAAEEMREAVLPEDHQDQRTWWVIAQRTPGAKAGKTRGTWPAAHAEPG